MALDQETIELILEAKNLSDKQLTEAAIAVERLGTVTDETEAKLDKLTVDKKNLSRFIELKTIIKSLKDEVVKTKVVNDEYAASVKKSSDATKEEKIQVEQNKESLKARRKELASLEKEYSLLDSQLKESGVKTRTFNKTLSNQGKEIAHLKSRLRGMNDAYRNSVSSLQESTVEVKKSNKFRREAINSAHDEAIAINKLIDSLVKQEQINKELAISEKIKADASKKARVEAERKNREEIRLLQINEKITESNKRRIQQEKESAIQSKKKAEEIKKLNKIQEQAIIQNRKFDEEQKKKIEQQKLEEDETKRVKIATDKYREALEKLNISLKKGNISKSKYIKKEIALRESLKLTEKQAKQTANALNRSGGLAGRTKATDKLTKVTRRLAQAYTVLIAAQKTAAVIGSNVKGYGDLETAMTKVQKTTNLAKDQLVSMTEQLQKMSKDFTPTATNELLRFAEVAGQLGANSTEEILQVASAADALSVSTNLAGEEAVTLLVRMLKMTHEGIPAIGNLSSSLVTLGNNFAAQEDEIALMTKEVITGTTAINLSSKAAAGYGATLRELGQTGERSRSAFSRLSGVLQKAAIEGGDDLKTLSNITKLTGDQIKESLGKDSEIVLSAFVEGLGRVKDEGGSVRQELGKFGITAEQSVQVFGALANNTERLAEAVDLSSKAYKAGNAHLVEAAKQYATQESSIKRLNNGFIELQASIGEAFSNETNSTLETLNELLNDNSTSVVEFANQVGDLIGDIIDIGKSFEGLLDTLGGFELIIAVVRTGLNDLAAGFNTIAIAIIELRKWYNALTGDFEGFKKASDDQAAALARLEGNVRSIQNAEKDWKGTSSATYRDLQESAVKYESAISLLSEEEQKRLKIALKTFDKTKEGVVEQVKLTAALVKASNVQKIAVQLQEKDNKLKEKTIENDKEIVRIKSLLSGTTKDLAGIEQVYTNQLKAGTITKERHAELIKLVKKEYDKTLGTLKEIPPAYDDLIAATQKGSDVTFALANSVQKSKDQLVKLNKSLYNAGKGGEEYNSIISKIASTTRKLEEDESKLAITRDLESKTLRELKVIQRNYNIEAERLQKLLEQNVISVSQYNEGMKELSTTLTFVNGVLGESETSLFHYSEALKIVTDSLNEQNKELQDKNDLTKEGLGLDKKAGKNARKNKKSNEESAQAVSLWAISQNRLNSELDFTDLTIDELNAKSKELGKEWKHLRATTSGWWDDLRKLNNQSVRREQETIKETIALKKLEERVASGALSAEQLDKAAQGAVYSFRLLGDEQLAPLRSAIKDAKVEFQDLTDTINNSFADTQDRLDALLGNEQDIVKRKFKRELDDLLKLLDKAKQAGDQSLVSKINEAIRNLKKAQNIEFKNQFGDKAKLNRNNNQQQNNNNQDGFGTTGNRTVTVNLNLNGNNTALEFANQSSANDFVNQMQALQEINSNGIG